MHTFDAMVYVGTVAAERAFWTGVVRALHTCAAPSARLLHPLTLPQNEARVREASRALGMAALKLSPHGARHGGPSHNVFMQLLTLDEVACRGRWRV